MSIGSTKVLSLENKTCLLEAGWDPERNVDTSEYERFLQTHNIQFLPSAKEFLIVCGWLEVKIPQYRYRNETDFYHLDPLRAAKNQGLDLDVYEERVGEKLNVIGEAYTEHMVLMMSESGKVYGAYDHFLTLMGNDGYEALEALYQGCNWETQVID